MEGIRVNVEDFRVRGELMQTGIETTKEKEITIPEDRDLYFTATEEAEERTPGDAAGTIVVDGKVRK